MRHRRLVWFGLSASIVAVWLTFWGRDDMGRQPKPHIPIACSISFQAYSNSPSGQSWAILLVSNNDIGKLCFAGPCLLVLSNRPSGDVETHWQLAPPIASRTCTQIAVEIPPESGTWRVGVTVLRDTWRDHVRELRSLGWPDQLLPRPTFGIRCIYTDWVPQLNRPTSRVIE